MRLLLDTQALIWWEGGSSKLGRRARAAIHQEAFRVLVSAATAWELALKIRSAKLRLDEPLDEWLSAAQARGGFEDLAVTIGHAVAVAKLPPHHADPFDRLLIAQAQLEGLTIVTSDSAFDAYDVKVLDART